MSSPDSTNNFFVHIYTTHAHKIIEDYIARNKKARIRRAKIETDIIRLTHENPDLPISHKVVCSSMIMHTNTFETFWSEQKLAYDLPDKSLQRLEPQYSLMDEVVWPQQEDMAESAVENLTTKDKDQDKDQGKEDDASTLSSAKKPGRGRPKKNSTTQEPRQPLSNKKNAQTQGPKAPRKRATTTKKKIPQTAALSESKPEASTTTKKTTTTTAAAAAAGIPTGVTKNVSPKKDTRTAAASPRGPLSAREAYEQCMARHQDEPKLRGPSSGEDDDDDDDDDVSTESEAE